MVDCLSNGETRCKGRPVASALGKRWQGWPAVSAPGNVVTRMASGFSTGKTCWWRMPGGSALEKHGGSEGHLIQQWENMLEGMVSCFSAGKV